MKFGNRIMLAWGVACFFAGTVSSSGALATEIEGVRLEESIKLANQELKLSGTGVRHRKDAKVLVVGLYLNGKYRSTQEVLAARGAKRTMLVMLQDLDTEKFVRSFIAGMRDNSDMNEKMNLVAELVKFGEICASAERVRKGDIITFDLIPGTGTLIAVNGKKLGEPLSNERFYDVFLKFFLGEKPTDPLLKRQLLGS